MRFPKVFFFLCCFSALSLLIFLFVTPKQPVKKIQPTISQIKPTPTPQPFVDLTIPYLRARSYNSMLGAKEKISENADYTTYLTSYTSDGLKINGLLTIPTGKPPQNGFPAIVFVHGYIPPKTYETNGQSYSRYVDYLARNGFVVFKIDLRGHGDSQGQAEGAYYSSAYVIDTRNAYAALEKSTQVNANKIGIWGHSMAGNVTLRTVATKPTIPALVIWAGAGYTYKDLVAYKITDASYDPNQASSSRKNTRGELQKLYGPVDTQKPFWHDLAPTSYLTDFKGAVELHHALDDQVVSVKYSQDLDTLLTEAHVTHSFYTYQSGGHNISDANFSVAMERTVAFFKKYLQ